MPSRSRAGSQESASATCPSASWARWSSAPSLHPDGATADRHRTLHRPERAHPVCRRWKPLPGTRWLTRWSMSAPSWAWPPWCWCCCWRSRASSMRWRATGCCRRCSSQVHPQFRTPYRHHRHRHLRRAAGGFSAAGYPGRAGFHRHAAGVHHRLRRRDGAARARAARQAAVPHAVRLGRRAPRHRHVRCDDGVLPIDTWMRLACGRSSG